MKENYILLLSALFMFVSTFGQSGAYKYDLLKSNDSTRYSNYKLSYPIVRDTLNLYPDSLIIQGELTDYVTGISCGLLCGCGAIKIKLTKENSKYPYEYLFIGVPCFNKLTNTLKKRKIWKVYKISMTDQSCYWTEVPINKFDSKGIPFYKIIN